MVLFCVKSTCKTRIMNILPFQKTRKHTKLYLVRFCYQLFFGWFVYCLNAAFNTISAILWRFVRRVCFICYLYWFMYIGEYQVRWWSFTSNTMVAKDTTETAYAFGAHVIIPVFFYRICVAQILLFMYCLSSCLLVHFLFGHCIVFYEWWLLITCLVSSNFYVMWFGKTYRVYLAWK